MFLIFIIIIVLVLFCKKLLHNIILFDCYLTESIFFFSNFDLEAKIKALPDLSLDDFTQRKKETKRKSAAAQSSSKGVGDLGLEDLDETASKSEGKKINIDS